MKHQNRLTQHKQEQEQALEQQAQQKSEREFANVEEMLRHDALHTPVPPAIAHRLAASVGQLPPSSRSFWKRLFGG